MIGWQSQRNVLCRGGNSRGPEANWRGREEGAEKKIDIFWSFKFNPPKNIKYHRLTRFIKGDTLVNWVSSTTLRGRPPCPPGRTSKWHVGTHLLIKEINISRLFLSFGCISFWKIARALYGCSQKGYWELQRNACEGFRIKGKLNCCKIKKFLCSLKT